MKNLFASAALAVLLFLAVPAQAQQEEGLGLAPGLGGTGGGLSLGGLPPAPEVINAKQAAMIYWRLAGSQEQTTPDFKSMALQTKEYKDAQSFQKENVAASIATDMRNTYDNLDFSRPMVVKMAIQLTAFSEKNRGFVIQNVEDQTYFKYSYAGENYAIVPLGLIDHQFLGPINDDDKVNKIKYSSKSGWYQLFIYVKPNYADSPKTLTEIDNEKYHIVSAPVDSVALFDHTGTNQLWADAKEEFNAEKNQELMNLKQ